MPETPDNAASDICPDPLRMAGIEEFVTSYQAAQVGIDWPGTVFARDTFIDQFGVFHRRSRPSPHKPDVADLAACDKIALRAMMLGPGDWLVEPSEADVVWQAFSSPALLALPLSGRIDQALIRKRFADAVSPVVSIKVWPLDALSSLPGREESKAAIDSFVSRFCALEGIAGHVFVQIGSADDQPQTAQLPAGVQGTACVFPRLIIGLTPRGGLAGIIAGVVQT